MILLDFYHILDLSEFIVINLFNISTFILFISRVKKPRITRIIGIFNLMLGIPIMVIILFNLILGRAFWYWFYPLILIAFMIFCLVVDYIRKVEFRKPRKLSILIPFLILFYVGVILMWGLTWILGAIYGFITGLTYFLQLFGAYYAGKRGVG
jgi:hypothetical protein